MGVIRDVMPAFELFQPTSVDGALELLDRHGASAMVLAGGLKTFEGPIIGAVIFFLLQEVFGDLGVWYLTGLGAVAVGFALYLPDGLWGTWRQRTGIDLLSGGVRLRQEAGR